MTATLEDVNGDAPTSTTITIGRIDRGLGIAGHPQPESTPDFAKLRRERDEWRKAKGFINEGPAAVVSSPAMARLQAIQSRESNNVPEQIVTRSFNGEDWHFLVMDFPVLAMALYDISKAKNGRANIVRAVHRAYLEHGVVSGPNDRTPFFDDDSLTAWLSAPATDEVWDTLKWIGEQVLSLNPGLDLSPKAPATAEAGTPLEESSPSPSATAPNGGQDGHSTDSVQG